LTTSRHCCMLTVMNGMIFDIQRFSTHDGNGIRTIVFFKGCPLRCRWCENPESQATQPELLFDPRHCINCASCLRPEAQGLMQRDQNGRITTARSRTLAGTAASIDAAALETVTGLCPSLAIRMTGRKMSSHEIIAEVLKDEIFFRNSGGGVTFSGGEPLLQPGLLLELATTLINQGLDCAIESCLAVGADNLAPFLDLPLTWLVDLKHTDAGVFREGTGGDLSLVLANMERLAGHGARLVFRVPVIPGFNDNDQALGAIVAYAAELSGKAGLGSGPSRPEARLDLLPYHEFAAGKYAALGRPYPYPQGLSVSRALLEHYARVGMERGLTTTIGG
jgi:pyruvate formate lyase activating enzyme